MSNVREQIAHAVADSFLSTKKACSEAAQVAFNNVSVAIEQHRRARLQPGEGLEVLSDLSKAANLQLDALALYHDCHVKLAEWRAEWRIAPNAFGPEDTPPSLRPAGERQLSAVA